MSDTPGPMEYYQPPLYVAGLISDIGALLVALVVVAVSCEWFLRRREGRKP